MKSEVCTWFGHAMLWGWKEKKMWFCLEDLSDCLVLRIKSGCRKDSEGDGADADGDSRWDRMHDLALSTVFHRLQLWDGLGVHFPLFLEGLLSFWWSGEDTKGMSGSALWALVRACILCLCQEMWNSPDLTLLCGLFRGKSQVGLGMVITMTTQHTLSSPWFSTSHSPVEN
jgi:hypothetical protein